MSYLHIENLYRAQEILLFRRCYAMEKIHGTSAHISWSMGHLRFFAGGESHERFCELFNTDLLTCLFQAKFGEAKVTIFGEAYGSKCQGMSKTYGQALRFVVFEVQIGECWLSVPQAFDVASYLGLDFVPFEEIAADLLEIDAHRDRDSQQAIKNGMGEGHMREGIVLRPLVEVRLNNGSRVIAKHKREEFAERRSIPEVDPSKREMVENADRIAEEWVTSMRLRHVLESLAMARIELGAEAPVEWDIRDTSDVIKAMVEDVCREAAGEIVESKEARKAIGHKTAAVFKAHLRLLLRHDWVYCQGV